MPILSSFGGGSIRGFAARQAIGGPGFIDWGTGAPTFAASSSYTVSEVDGHFGMHTDSFGRYVIIQSRGYNSNGGPPYYNIYIPIIEGGLDLANRFRVYYPNPEPEENSFGGLTDTIRGLHWHHKYGDAQQTAWQLPAALTGLSAGVTPSISGDQTLTATSFITSINIGNNDGGHHDGYNDVYYYAGRNDPELGYRAAGTSGTLDGTISLQGRNAYGVTKDPSSGYFLFAYRAQGFDMLSPGGGVDLTYASSSQFSSVEDVVVGWTGDAYLLQSGPDGTSPSLQRFRRY